MMFVQIIAKNLELYEITRWKLSDCKDDSAWSEELNSLKS